MAKWTTAVLLVAILLVGLALRWTGIDWDAYNHYHPDERFITWVATTIEWPSTWRAAFNPTETSFNPFYWSPSAASEGIEVLQDERRDFAYGHLPLYLGVAATRLVEAVAAPLHSFFPQGWLLTRDLLNAREAVEFRHLTAVTRALTGLADGVTILLTFFLGRRLFNTPVALLGAAFLALNVMHIQLSHFFTTDPYLTLFVIAALFFMVRALQVQRVELQARLLDVNLLLAGIMTGFAVGSKFAAVMLLLPLLATALLSGRRSWLWRFVGAALVAGFTFVITNPFAVLDIGCTVLTPAVSLGSLEIPALNWGSCYLENVLTQSAMVRGELELGFTQQYMNTLPYLYFIEMQVRWGMGWILGVFAFAGFGWAGWRSARALQELWSARGQATAVLTPATAALLVVMSWAVPYFLVTGAFYVKFMRYMMPLTPLLMIFAAALIWQWRSAAGRRVLAGVVLLATALYTFSFMQIYAVDHPWNLASRWVYQNVPPGTLIASEQWDDALPTTLQVDGEWRRRSEYVDEQLTWLSGTGSADDLEKLRANLDLLSRAGYVTVLSNRVYGVAPRLPDEYPLSGQYHQLLFDGSLGYRPVFMVTRVPQLAGLRILPDPFVWPGLVPPDEVAGYLDALPGLNGGRFDESFTVYDQPLVMIFQNVERKSAAELQALFDPSS